MNAQVERELQWLGSQFIRGLISFQDYQNAIQDLDLDYQQNIREAEHATRMKTKLELLEMLIIELALMALKNSETSAGERRRINHILGDLQYADQKHP